MSEFRPLTDEELLARLRSEEDSFVERKSKHSRNEVVRTAVAFANTVRSPREGVVFFGINATGEVLGLENVENAQQDIRTWLDDCYPSLPFYTRVLNIDDKKVLALVVTESPVPPHFAGPAYVRIGSSSTKASDQMLNRLVENRLDPVRRLRVWEGKVIGILIPRSYGFGTRGGKVRTWDFHEATLEEVTADWVIWRRLDSSERSSASIREIVLQWDTSGKERPILRLLYDYRG